jgi:ABC-2 type transport system permease protein/sodium transport system permease protein
LTTTLLGLVLGVMAWRSGSVIPGMIFHALHNSTLVLLAYYKPQLETWDWVPKEESYLPVAWVVGSAVVAGIGFLLIMVGRKRVSAELPVQAAP